MFSAFLAALTCVGATTTIAEEISSNHTSLHNDTYASHPMMQKETHHEDSSDNLSKYIKKIFPSSHVRIDNLKNVHVFTGTVDSTESMLDIEEIAGKYYGKEHIVSMINSPSENIMLSVAISTGDDKYSKFHTFLVSKVGESASVCYDLPQNMFSHNAAKSMKLEITPMYARNNNIGYRVTESLLSESKKEISSGSTVLESKSGESYVFSDSITHGNDQRLWIMTTPYFAKPSITQHDQSIDFRADMKIAKMNENTPITNKKKSPIIHSSERVIAKQSTSMVSHKVDNRDFHSNRVTIASNAPVKRKETVAPMKQHKETTNAIVAPQDLSSKQRNTNLNQGEYEF